MLREKVGSKKQMNEEAAAMGVGAVPPLSSSKWSAMILKNMKVGRRIIWGIKSLNTKD